MDLLATKLVVLVLMVLLQLLPGLLPVLLSSRMRKHRSDLLEKLIGAVLCVGGGVLLATVFIHMTPEVRETLLQAARLGTLPGTHYPFAELSICVGYLVVYFFEALINAVMGHGHGHGNNSGQVVAKTVTARRSVEDLRSNNQMTSVGSETSLDLASSPRGMVNSSTEQTIIEDEEQRTSGIQLRAVGSEASLGITFSPNAEHQQPLAPPETVTVDVSLASKADSVSSLHETTAVSTLRSIVFVVAMSTHNVFEGMAIGLQLMPSDVWQLFVAVQWHGVVILFCIGVDMVAASTRTVLIVVYVSVISVMSPLGIVVGLLVTENVDKASGTQAVVIGMLQGVAAGTLLYVTFSEVLNKQRMVKSGMDGLAGFGFILLGFVAMVVAETVFGDVANHGFGDEAPALNSTMELVASNYTELSH